MTNHFEDEILILLLQMLPREMSYIKTAYESHDYEELRRLIHKLRGALCYCDAPELRHAAIQLDSALKSNHLNDVSMWFNKLETEIDVLIKSKTDMSS